MIIFSVCNIHSKNHYKRSKFSRDADNHCNAKLKKCSFKFIVNALFQESIRNTFVYLLSHLKSDVFLKITHVAFPALQSMVI